MDIEQLVCRMARENEWGYGRIQGELKKLDIEISKTSVANILRRNGLAGVCQESAQCDLPGIYCIFVCNGCFGTVSG